MQFSTEIMGDLRVVYDIRHVSLRVWKFSALRNVLGKVFREVSRNFVSEDSSLKNFDTSLASVKREAKTSREFSAPSLRKVS